MKNLKIITCLFFLSILILSCTKSEDNELLESKEVLNYIKNLGFSSSKIIDNGKEFIVEGDISFAKDMKVPKTSKSSKINQNYCGSIVDFAHRKNIKVFIDQSMSSRASEISSAINLWNDAGAEIHFDLVTSGTYDILIINDDNVTTYGLGTLPINGLPGSKVRVNLIATNRDCGSYYQFVCVIAHELGHNIGFAHTDDMSPTVYDITSNISYPRLPVPNMGSLDNSSIMIQGGSNSAELSLFDKGAAYALYPVLYPTNMNLSLNSYSTEFKVSWDPNPPILDNKFIGYDISYGGFSGINFGGSTSVSNSLIFTIPNVSPNPNSGSTNTGGIQITITAKYTDSYYNASRTITKNKVNGVWQ
jgi:hypothetical protein